MRSSEFIWEESFIFSCKGQISPWLQLHWRKSYPQTCHLALWEYTQTLKNLHFPTGKLGPKTPLLRSCVPQIAPSVAQVPDQDSTLQPWDRAGQQTLPRFHDVFLFSDFSSQLPYVKLLMYNIITMYAMFFIMNLSCYLHLGHFDDNGTANM